MNEGAADAPIAVVGIGALYPGSSSTDGFWRNILNGTNLISETPPSHWLISDYFDPDQAKEGKTYSKFGGFLEDIPFDPLENAIPPANLSATDTAQLLALIAAKRTLHDACGLDFTRIDRDRVSVILGVASATELAATMAGSLQYPVWRRAMQDAGLAESDIHRVTGLASESYVEWNESTFPGLLGNVVAGRIANRFGFGGANCVVDAACASSLGAVRMAVQELALGHADMVLTGGVDALNDIFMFICFSRTPAMSPSGKVRPFDKFADGTLLGEGVGMLALRRLADAERDGDRIYAVLRGIGASSDGRAKSIYAPRAEGQMKALERAYRSAGYGPDTVELVEAHGTGTIAGDLAELESLRRVFRQSPQRGFPWAALGSVKSQIGHTKGAAGAASLIKTVLALHHKVLPPTINVEEPHEVFREPDCALYLNTQLRPWIRGADHPRRASVSSFGFGGSNFHAAVEEYVGPSPRPLKVRRSSCELFLFSAAERASLDQTSAAAVELLSQGKSFASAARESQLAFDRSAAQRLAVVASTPAELRKLLDRFAAGEGPARGLIHAFGPPLSGAIAFLFPGQGSQYVNMGAGLACAFDLARAPWDELADGPLADLARIVFPPPAFEDASRARQAEILTATDRAQPAIAACSLSYLNLLRAAGVRANMAGGHSFGEITALCAASAFEADALMAIATERGRLMAQAAQTAGGAMLAVFASRSDVEAINDFATSGVVVANHNAPSQAALAGSIEDIGRFKGVLSALGIKFSALPVAAAFHSPLVAQAAAPLRDYLRRMPFRPPDIPVYSNLTAKPYPSAEAIPDLLADQISAPVRFVEQIEAMYANGARVFVEVGPGSVLAGLTRQCLDGRPHLAVSLDGRDNNELSSWWAAIGQLAVAGVEIDLAPFWAGYATEPVEDGPRSPATVRINGSNFGKRYPAPARRPRPAETVPVSRPVSSSTAELPQPISVAAPSDRDEFGLQRSKLMNARNSQIGERDAGGRPDPAFPGPILEFPMQKPVNAPQVPTDLDRVDDRTSLIAEIVRASSEAHQAAQNAMASAHLAYLRATEAAIQALGGGAARASSLEAQGGAPPMPIALPLEGPRLYDLKPSEPPAFPGYSAPSVATPKSGAYDEPLPNGAAANGAPLATPPAQKTQDVSVNDLVLEIVARETGYPADMLRPDMSLESDLGIDSIKRVEILAAVKAAAPELPDIAANELAGLDTLGSIAARLAKFTDGGVSERPLAAPSPAATQDLTSIVLAIVARETGYPVEMLSPEMNLESDLGIDSIKRVEILSAVREAVPGLPELQAGDLIGLSTLGAISARLQGGGDGPTSASAEEPAPRAPELRRYALELVSCAPASAAASPALASILGGPDDLSEALVAALARRGVRAHRGLSPSPEADAAILLHGLSDAAPGALAEQAIAAARLRAPGLATRRPFHDRA